MKFLVVLLATAAAAASVPKIFHGPVCGQKSELCNVAVSPSATCCKGLRCTKDRSSPPGEWGKCVPN